MKCAHHTGKARGYEQQIQELEKELVEQSKENVSS